MKTASFGELWNAYPKGSRDDLIHSLKGGVEEAMAGKKDDSALRLSFAFNRTGHSLPKSSVYSGVDVKVRGRCINYRNAMREGFPISCLSVFSRRVMHRIHTASST